MNDSKEVLKQLLEALELLLIDAEAQDEALQMEFGSSRRVWKKPYTFEIARQAIVKAKKEIYNE